MSTAFYKTLNPTPFGVFDDEEAFQSDADSIVLFVKRKLGDDILSVELTKKQIWACFEEAGMEYGTLINEYQTKSQLSNLMGLSTGSNVQGKYAHETMDFILRLAEPYAQEKRYWWFLQHGFRIYTISKKPARLRYIFAT